MKKVKAKVLKYMINERRRAKIKIIINEVPLSKNKYVNMHWAKRRSYKNDISWLVMRGIVKRIKSKYKKAKIVFDIYFKTNRKRDVQNYLGGGLIVWLDALVDHNIIADDSYIVIGQPIVNFHIDRANPRTEIIIEGR